jgi:hypothetical protein
MRRRVAGAGGGEGRGRSRRGGGGGEGAARPSTRPNRRPPASSAAADRPLGRPTTDRPLERDRRGRGSAPVDRHSPAIRSEADGTPRARSRMRAPAGHQITAASASGRPRLRGSPLFGTTPPRCPRLRRRRTVPETRPPLGTFPWVLSPLVARGRGSFRRPGKPLPAKRRRAPSLRKAPGSGTAPGAREQHSRARRRRSRPRASSPER